jgi:murein DD-endopeptidase MepM/ murein hydrolase activator NlpD
MAVMAVDLARTRLIVALCTATVLLGLALAAAAPGSAGPPGAPPPAATYRLPLREAADVTRRFEQPPAPWAAGHRGIDLRSSIGADVLSPVAGVVTFAGAVGGRRVVTVTDAQGRRSSVEPLVPGVEAGALVAAGTRLGALALDGSHCVPDACLHWGVRVGADYIGPLALLPGAGPVVLLPLPAG